MNTSDPSFCKWFNLDTRDIETLVNDIITEYNKVQDAGDGSSMFPGELHNLIMRVARTNSDGMLDVCDNKNEKCLGYCTCVLPKPYQES